MYSVLLLKSRKVRPTKTSKPQKEVQYNAKSMSVSICSNEVLNDTALYSIPRYHHIGQTSSKGLKAVNNSQQTKPNITTVTLSNEKFKGNETMMSTYEDMDHYEGLYN